VDDLVTWLQQQFENQRHRADALKAMAAALPPEAGAYLTETADMLLADVDAKRRIVDGCLLRGEQGQQPGGEVFGYHATGMLTAIRILAEVYADRPGYREEWRP
jgi:hypothetical protein